MSKYYCEVCGLEVLLLPNGEIIRACKCQGSIILDLEVTCTGKSSTEVGK